MITEKAMESVHQSRVLGKLKVLQMDLSQGETLTIIIRVKEMPAAGSNFYFQGMGSVPPYTSMSPLYRMERIASAEDEGDIKEFLPVENNMIIRCEMYAGLSDVRFLTGMIAIESEPFAAGILLKRIKELTEKRNRQ